MSWQLAPFTVVLFFLAAALVALGVAAWRHRPAPSAAATAVIIWLAAGWAALYAGELAAPELPLKIVFAKLQYISIVTIPVVWLSVVLQYTDRDRWLTPQNLVLAAIIPSITLLLAWTNELHGLIWQTTGLNSSGPFPVLEVAYGQWFWVHVAYSYFLIFLGISLLSKALEGSSKLSRGQIIALLISIATPTVGSILFVLKIRPVPNLDLTTYALIVTGSALAWSLFRSKFLSLAPIARDRVVESMTDGLMVLDPQNRIVDVNPAALQMLGRSADLVIGQSIEHILSVPSSFHKPGFEEESGLGEVVLGQGNASKTYAMHVSRLPDRKGRLRGRLILFSDLTGQQRTQLTLEDTIRRKDIAYQQALIYSNELNQEIRARKKAEEAMRALSRRLAEVQEAERRHLARELHDEVGQALTGLRFVLESSHGNGFGKLNQGLEIINGLIEQVHDMSLDLRPTVLDDLGLLPALSWYIERYSLQRSITVNFRHRGISRRFSPELETAAYRIVQEGLTNVSRHANADQVDVTVWATEDKLDIQVEDTGRGFDLAQALSNPNSSGLVGMQERVALLGGVLAIDSTPEEGTRLAAKLPLKHSIVKQAS